MDTQQNNPNTDPATRTSSSPTTKKKIAYGFGGVFIVCIVAASTFGVLIAQKSQQANQLKKAETSKPETASSIESQIQSSNDSEQKADVLRGSAESQVILDDVNATESLEGNYADF